MSDVLRWQTLDRAQGIVDRCNKLDEATVQIVVKIRKLETGAVTKSGGETVEGETRCILCDAPAGAGSKSFSLTPESREWVLRVYPDADPEAVLLQSTICAKCQKLPPGERQDLAQRAIARELKSYQDFIRGQI